MKRSTQIASLALVAVLGTSLGAMAHGKGGHRGMKGAQIEFSQLDTDGNGEITQAEIDAQKAARFAEIDADGNGTVSAEELLAFHAAKRAEAGKEIKEGKEERAEKMAERMIKRMDENDDGVLSVDEMSPEKGGKSFIERLDTDENGTVSEAEFDAAKERMKDRMKKKGDKK